MPLTQYASSVTALSNLGMLVVWLVYAHLLYQSHKRQRQARLRISQVKGHSADSICLIANLGHESMYIERIFAVVQTEGGTATIDWTDRPASSPETSEPTDLTRQGPLAPGDYMVVGRFSEALEELSPFQRQRLRLAAGDLAPGTFSLRVVAFYGPEDQPIGAERQFRMHREHGRLCLRPEAAVTRRLVSRRERRTAATWLKRDASSRQAAHG